MNSIYDGIKQVIVVRWPPEANHYLEHNYRLLDVQSVSREKRMSDDGRSYVWRGFYFVLGRPWDVEVAPPIPLLPPREEEVETSKEEVDQ